MKKLYLTLLATTCLAYSSETLAQTTVTTFDNLTSHLTDNAEANIVFDGVNTQNIDGFLTINKGQSVELKNISSWTNSLQEFSDKSGNQYIAGTIPTESSKERLIMNNGTLAIKSMTVKNNSLMLASTSSVGGSIIQNRGTITELSNLFIDNNTVNTLKKNDLWGGLVSNINGGTIEKIADSTFSNNTFLTQQSAPHGAVIYNEFSTINLIDNVIFKNNTMQALENQKGGGHGTVIDNNEAGIIKKITNSQFINNKTYKPGDSNPIDQQNHASGGAIDNYNFIEEISNSLFQGNCAEIESANRNGKMFARGGAIILTQANQAGVEGRIDNITNVDFIENFARNIRGEALGGAIATSGNSKISKMNNVLFRGNYAQGDGTEDGVGQGLGGGIYNNGSIGEINGIFEGNKAISKNAVAQGGAIWSKGTITKIKDTTFINNSAVGGKESAGGAIYNTGIIGFEGTTIFQGNKAGNDFNDIYNTGSITFNDNITLDGGIAGTGSVVFAQNSSLTAELNKTTILAGSVNFAGNNSLSFKVKGVLEDKEYDFITATLTGVDNVSIAENTLYNMQLTDDGKISVTAKSSEEINSSLSDELGGEDAEKLTSILKSGTTNDTAISLADNISSVVQDGAYSQVKKGLKELAPGNSQQILSLSQSINYLITNITNKHLEETGMSSGDERLNSSLWAKAVYTSSKQDGTSSQDGFDADTSGLVLGADKKISENTLLGLGYAYTKTDANIENKNVDIDGHSFFVYGSYKPNNWYINALASYGYNEYSENKSPFGVLMASDYEVDTYAVNLTSGYNFNNGLTPEVGLRYILVDQEKYSDGVQEIDTDSNDVLTAVAGIKYSADINFDNMTINPTVSIAATYDLMADDGVANVNIINGTSYQIISEKLNRFGVEAGLGLNTQFDNIDLGVEYLGNYRKDFNSHSGILKVKYNF